MHLVLPLLFAAAVVDVPPPPTVKRPVVDEYFGDKVQDDYRWLEDWNDKQVQAWSDAQNARARKILDALPYRPEIEKRLTELLSFESPAYRAVIPRAGVFFSLKQQPPKQQPFIVVSPSLTGDVDKSERVVVDPNTIDNSGGTSIDFYVPSPDGKHIAVSLSKGGSESGSVHVFDVATGKDGDVVPRANSGTAGGTLAWSVDGKGFWYTRHPQAPEVKADDDGFYQQVAFHALGTDPNKDTVELGAMKDGTRVDLVRNAENFLEASDDGKWVLDLVQKGDGGEYDLWIRSAAAGAPWKETAKIEDGVVGARFAPDGTVWLLSHKNAGRGKIMKLDPSAASVAAAKLVVRQGKATINAFEVTGKRVYLLEQLGGPSQLRSVDLAGKHAKTLRILPVSSVGGLQRTGAEGVVFENQSFTVPPAWFLAGADGKVTPTALAERSPANMSNVVVERREARSRDGTKVPFTLLRAKGTKLGKAPTLLTGYGGFSIAIAPAFHKAVPAWLEQGGVYVVANLRGGSEFGEAWHQAGMKTHKQHVFDDFLAVAHALTHGARRVTTTDELAIEGGSNGGLLMGAALTQKPDQFKCVVARVGYFDMLRYETKPNGAFNATEYGSVKNEAEYKALKAYSPYANVKDGVKYPPTLFLTGANDPRVDPLHSRKMVARLQGAGAQAILRTSGSTGHGIGTPLSAKIAETVDIDAFLFAELGVAYHAPVTASSSSSSSSSSPPSGGRAR